MHWAGGSGYPQPFAPRAGDEPSHGHHHHHHQEQEQQAWLNLGKRPCCWAGGCQQVQQQQQPSWGGNGSTAGGGSGITAAAEGKRKEKAAAVVPRCQVEGCHVALTGVKEYHRRHKVCEAHSKAPRVVVLGAEQRFCQQCSRFHAISEFDDAKRSCRRRLAGHNERRRKSNASEAMARSAGHPHGMMPFGFPPCGLPTSPAGALSLLSSARGGAPWLIPAAADISARSSAALDELIAENRASLLAWQFFSDRSPGRGVPVPSSSIMGRVLPGEAPVSGWQIQAHHHPGEASFEAPSAGHTTLDLMQTAGAPFRPGPERTAKKDGDDDAGCSGSHAWASSVEGAAPGRVV
ncbi:hypothetical protein PR202_gb14764 [Eleusine coracana subsp. coracana]|uniref:SBP-type domain-containing protein n=1 Tax=Eleusine coracana subsp. coracana TaxID=191504 RepID=A0AAV5ETU8_ELECO|nr:hypothetical protein PR202_gb14764 [Eleusine coracana subsp. coracana]